MRDNSTFVAALSSNPRRSTFRTDYRRNIKDSKIEYKYIGVKKSDLIYFNYNQELQQLENILVQMSVFVLVALATSKIHILPETSITVSLDLYFSSSDCTAALRKGSSCHFWYTHLTNKITRTRICLSHFRPHSLMYGNVKVQETPNFSLKTQHFNHIQYKTFMCPHSQHTEHEGLHPDAPVLSPSTLLLLS